MLKATGVSAAVAEIERVAARFGATNLPMGQLLLFLAKSVIDHHPKLALDVCLHAQSLENAPIEATLIAGSLQDRLGDRIGSQASMRVIIESDAAEPLQKLRAANLLVRFGDQEVALNAARVAFAAMGRPIEHAATLLYIAQVTADWHLVAELTDQLRAGYNAGLIEQINEAPRTHLLWCDDEALNLKVLNLWSKRNLPDPIRPSPEPEPLTGRRLRIGYLSSDFREHPTARLILGVLRHHDRSQVELFMYCSGWDDGSQLRKDVEQQFENIHSVAALSDEAAADLIRSHQVDVLIELNGPTRAHRMGILRHRPAPVQIDYLGWPGSVGGRVVDYVIGDEHTVPVGAERLYPEKVIRLHPTYQANDHAMFKRAPKPTRKEVSLPEDPSLQILGMFNAINKVHQQVWDTWMQILRDVPNSMLWMLDPGPAARKSIAQAAQKARVPVSRILASPKLPHALHLARIQCCDLMLDPWPYGGHTSTADALFSGVPVLAMEGNNFASRVSAGLLRAAGLDSMVCKTPDAYVSRAVELLHNPAALDAMREQLMEHGQIRSVFDTASRTRQLELAYRVAVDRACQGLPQQHCTLALAAPQNNSSAQLTSVSRARSDVKSERLCNSELVLVASAVRSASKVSKCTNGSEQKIPMVLVCGPWSSGTSAVAGMLANAGLQAPGPYVKVNDPQTSATYEMKAFQGVLRELASEQTLRKLTTPLVALQRLCQFRDEVLSQAISRAPEAPPLMLKHGLASLFLKELCALFEVRLVGVLRPHEDIEATRVRRNWLPGLGQQGAEVLYRALFDHLVNSQTPFHLVRYPELLAAPSAEFDRLMTFCGVSPIDAQRQAALAFVDRPASAQGKK
ncbi:putative O-linked N-acetylglucosamine transferase (SPINDLY family) [Roseicyclus mahoneyensis]|uniref:Putative O-linked N-acetylglucosamine transferase (SPINDLY family) n=2 Tax=Roseicyclus mahoneyensis TaxID=164332 RepID=A0A316G382_9RHOB|nr:putative O-linked N-acetylglucosamine transferase (SPINDLY family) [Roseicyclus mahoneyensis]